MTPTPTERRVKSRIRIEGPLTYHLEDSLETHEGKLEDLSERGASIWIKQELPVTSQLVCSVKAADPEDPDILFRATLMHTHPEQRDSIYGYGCSIEEIKHTE